MTSAIGVTAGAAAVLVAGYFLLRSAEPRPGRDAAEDARLRALLAAHGSADSLGYFALRADKEVVFSPSGKAAVAHRVLAGVALASGDPVGDPEAWPGGVAAFLADCTANGWVPGVLGCSERGAGVYARFGLDALEIGDEAVLRTAGFSLDGRAMRGVRQSVARARRAGYEVRVRTVAAVPAAEREALAALAAGWRGAVAERGYSMALSRIADAVDPDAVLVTAERRDDEGGVQVHALLQLVPWGADGLSLDAMRRDPAADGGLTELMIAELMAAAPSAGGGAGVAELRGVPGRARTGRPDRRRAGGPAVGARAAGRLAVVAAGEPLPVQREVRPRVGAAVRRLPVGAGAAPGARRGAGGRGLRRPAARAAAAAAPLRPSGARRRPSAARPRTPAATNPTPPAGRARRSAPSSRGRSSHAWKDSSLSQCVTTK